MTGLTSGSCLYLLLANVVYLTLVMFHVMLTSVLQSVHYQMSFFCRDLGVTMTSTLSMSRHINDIAIAIAPTAYQRVNCILRSFVSGDVALLVRAFTPTTYRLDILL